MSRAAFELEQACTVLWDYLPETSSQITISGDETLRSLSVDNGSEKKNDDSADVSPMPWLRCYARLADLYKLIGRREEALALEEELVSRFHWLNRCPEQASSVAAAIMARFPVVAAT